MSNSNSNSGSHEEAEDYEVIVWIPEIYKVRAKSLQTAERIVRHKLELNKHKFPMLQPFIHSIRRMLDIINKGEPPK